MSDIRPAKFELTVVHLTPYTYHKDYGDGRTKRPRICTFQFTGTDGKQHKTKKFLGFNREDTSVKLGDVYIAVRQYSIPAETYGFHVPHPDLVKGCSWHPWWLLTFSHNHLTREKGGAA